MGKLIAVMMIAVSWVALPAEGGVAPALPVVVPEGTWEPLYEHVDPELQGQLEQALARHAEWHALVRKKRMAVGVVDLSDPEHPRFARVNGNTMMYAASLPKIAILLAAYAAFEDGSLEETPEVHADLQAMIRKSSNSPATRMIDRLGFEKIEAVLSGPPYRLFDKARGGGLWVGKRYAKAGARHPDPLMGLSHGATVTQVCRFYYLLANGKLVSLERSRQILDDLSKPGIQHKFVSVLKKRAPGVRLFRKSGTWKQWHSDSALVWGDVWRRYIIAGIVESEEGEQILRDLTSAVEDLLRPAAVAGDASDSSSAPLPGEPQASQGRRQAESSLSG